MVTPDRTAAIRAVLFDADGVLQRARPGWREQLAALVPGRDVDAFVTDVLAAEVRPLYGAADFPDELAAVLDRWHVRAPVEQVLANWAAIEVFPGVLEVVRSVRAAGVACYLATNQHAFRTARMRSSIGYQEVFDDAFYSCELRLAKPDPAFFGAILDRIGWPGSAVLFVDDNPANVDGARIAGLRAERFCADADTGAAALRTLLDRYAIPSR